MQVVSQDNDNHVFFDNLGLSVECGCPTRQSWTVLIGLKSEVVLKIIPVLGQSAPIICCLKRQVVSQDNCLRWTILAHLKSQVILQDNLYSIPLSKLQVVSWDNHSFQTIPGVCWVMLLYETISISGQSVFSVLSWIASYLLGQLFTLDNPSLSEELDCPMRPSLF